MAAQRAANRNREVQESSAEPATALLPVAGPPDLGSFPGQRCRRLPGSRIGYAAATWWPFQTEDFVTTDAIRAADPAVPVAGGVLSDLAALRIKAGCITRELADLHRRMDQLQQQISAHQQR